MNTLYHHYDKHDNLLYVGVTCNLHNRNREHKRSSFWFPKVTRITLRYFGSRRSALREEAREISENVPCFNYAHNVVTEAYVDMEESKKIERASTTKKAKEDYNLPDSSFYGIDEVSDRLRMTWAWVDKKVREKKIASVVMGKNRFVNSTELERVMKEGVK